MPEAPILASTNPQYDKRLFIELRVKYVKISSSEHVENMLCTQIVFCFCFDIHDTRISASERDFPVNGTS